jgi:hypothetical protein
MPLRKITQNNRTGYQWGESGKRYFGRGARMRALRQARAIYASGYKKKR